MEYLRIFNKAVGWNWVRIPGIVFGLLTAALALASQYGITEVSAVPTTFLLIGSVAIVAISFIIGLLHFCVMQSRRLRELENAYDRSGRHLLPIKEVMELIQRNLADQIPVDADGEKKRRFAANKLRELGHENQMAIWGRQYHEDEQVFEEFNQEISADFWIKNHIDPRVVYSTYGLSVPQTATDARYDLDLRPQNKYGLLGVSKYALAAMCPPPET